MYLTQYINSFIDICTINTKGNEIMVNTVKKQDSIIKQYENVNKDMIIVHFYNLVLVVLG